MNLEERTRHSHPEDDGRAVLQTSAALLTPPTRRIQQCTEGESYEVLTIEDEDPKDKDLHQPLTRPRLPLKPNGTPYVVDLTLNEPCSSPTSPDIGRNIFPPSLVPTRQNLLNDLFKELTYETDRITQLQRLGVEIVGPDAPWETPDQKPKNGTVQRGDIRALKRLLSWETESETTTGIVLSKGITPSQFNSYKENEDFKVLSELGEGSYGKVSLIEDCHTKAAFVLKRPTQGRLHAPEVSVPSQLNHVGISRIHGLIWRGVTPEIIMDFAGISLDKIAAGGAKHLLTEANIMDITKQGFDVLEYLKLHDIIHMDVKPQNLCLQWIDGKFLLKFCDFGACKPAGVPLSDKGWTPAYMAPEQCRYALNKMQPSVYSWSAAEMELTTQIDVYSFCCSILYMCYLQHCLLELLKGKNVQQLIFHVAYNPAVMRTFVQEDWDPRLKTVLVRAFCAKPNERITPTVAGEILTGPGPKVIHRGRGRPKKPASQVKKPRKTRKRASASQRMSCESTPEAGTEDMDVDVPTPGKHICLDPEPMAVDSPGVCDQTGLGSIIILDLLSSAAASITTAGNIPDFTLLLSD